MKRFPLLPALLALLVAATFANTLRGGFVLDDHALIEQNPRAQSLDGVFRAFATDVQMFQSGTPVAHPYYRPLVIASFVVDRAAWGPSPGPFHVQNLLWHLLACLLAYALVRRLFGSAWVAASAAGLWAVHPIVSDSVAWISGRTDPMAACGILGALLAYARYRDTGRGRWLALAALGTYAGCLAKEIAALTPVMALVIRPQLESARARPARPAPARPWLEIAALAAPVAVYLAQRQIVIAGNAAPATVAPHDVPAALRVALQAVAYYAKSLVWPLRLVGDIHARVPRWTDPGVLLGAGLLLALLGIVAARRSATAVPLALAALTALPASGVLVPLVIPVALRFLYLPSLWLWVALLVWIEQHFAARPGFARVRAAATTGALLALAALTVARNRDYRDDASFFASVVRHAAGAGFGVEPGTPTLQNYGYLSLMKGNAAAAERYTRQAIEEEPGSSVSWNNLGGILAANGDRAGALDAWSRAEALDPTSVNPIFNRAVVLDQLRRYPEAIAAYRMSLARGVDAERRKAIEERLPVLEARVRASEGAPPAR